MRYCTACGLAIEPPLLHCDCIGRRDKQIAQLQQERDCYRETCKLMATAIRNQAIKWTIHVTTLNADQADGSVMSEEKILQEYEQKACAALEPK